MFPLCSLLFSVVGTNYLARVTKTDPPRPTDSPQQVSLSFHTIKCGNFRYGRVKISLSQSTYMCMNPIHRVVALPGIIVQCVPLRNPVTHSVPPFGTNKAGRLCDPQMVVRIGYAHTSCCFPLSSRPRGIYHLPVISTHGPMVYSVLSHPLRPYNHRPPSRKKQENSFPRHVCSRYCGKGFGVAFF